MAGWMNGDGLYVKFGSDEGDLVKGGHIKTDEGHFVEFDVLYTDLGSATYSVLGSALASGDGSFGVSMPEGARIEEVEAVVLTAFTVSGGLIANATFGLGLKKSSDRSTELDHDGFMTASATGTVLGLATVGTKTVIRVGSTGAGALLGTSLSENGVVCLANTTHATNPYNAGKARVRIKYAFLA